MSGMERIVSEEERINRTRGKIRRKNDEKDEKDERKKKERNHRTLNKIAQERNKEGDGAGGSKVKSKPGART